MAAPGIHSAAHVIVHEASLVNVAASARSAAQAESRALAIDNVHGAPLANVAASAPSAAQAESRAPLAGALCFVTVVQDGCAPERAAALNVPALLDGCVSNRV